MHAITSRKCVNQSIKKGALTQGKIDTFIKSFEKSEKKSRRT